jgi:hypothetical protein
MSLEVALAPGAASREHERPQEDTPVAHAPGSSAHPSRLAISSGGSSSSLSVTESSYIHLSSPLCQTPSRLMTLIPLSRAGLDCSRLPHEPDPAPGRRCRDVRAPATEGPAPPAGGHGPAGPRRGRTPPGPRRPRADQLDQRQLAHALAANPRAVPRAVASRRRSAGPRPRRRLRGR